MTRIELIYDQDCPNVPDARRTVLEALGRLGIPPKWQEWDRADPAAPAHVRRYGSPTVLVDGRDVEGQPPAAEAGEIPGIAAATGAGTVAPSCRVYSNASGRGSDASGRGRGVPSVAMIARALGGESTAPPVRGRTGVAAALPAIGVALLPKLTCAACWPAYAAVLGAMGVNFMDYTPYLAPATAFLLALTLLLIGWRGGRRRGYRPLWLGLLASAVILIGKFGFDSDLATYGGAALLVAASVWNAWPRRRAEAGCPACAVPVSFPASGGAQ